MRMISRVLGVLFIGLGLMSCSNNSEYLIKKGQVGPVNELTEVQDLEDIFSSDSLVSRLSEGELGLRGSMVQGEDQYLVYSLEGEHLMTLVADQPLDSTSLIKRVEVYSPKYMTSDGVGIGSKFEDVNLNLTINRVEKSFTSATLFIDELNATMVIDQKELGIKSLRPGELSLEQIPEAAKFKAFTVWLN
ncbi:MAG: hypothetical protein ACPGRE_01635 [Flavobacteriaceae bacterium]